MIPDPVDDHGLLPPGRYRTTREEVYERFVAGHGGHRERLWRDWTVATSLLRRHVHVSAAWLYGRFLSADPEPEVVQCLYWAEDLELGQAHLDPASTHILRAFSQRGKVRDIVGVKVETHLLAWHCQPDPHTEDHYLTPYLERRGRVDDYLQRMRLGPRGSLPARQDALPRRGYVEVIVDDYQ